MEFLKSSIVGHDFVNYRKSRPYSDRVKFSSNTRKAGVGLVPIVVDSVDDNTSKKLGGDIGEKRYRRYGKEYKMHIDKPLSILLARVERDIEGEDLNMKLRLGLEDGVFPDTRETLGDLYKKNRNNRDEILYFLVTREKTMYGYILSILRYIGNTFRGNNL